MGGPRGPFVAERDDLSATPRQMQRLGGVLGLQWMEKFGEGPDLRVGLTSAEQPGATMAQQPMSRVTEVAACTMAAAHRRDHDHGLGDDACHPHVVEIVHLGRRAVCVCHDCQLDSGFLPCREAEALAAGHRDLTLHISVKLRSA
jgi:hypothetical protein